MNSETRCKNSKISSLIAFVIVPVFLTITHLVLPADSFAAGDQTREQCERCCQSAVSDEYSLEQCKLKCFRNPDHCADRKAGRPVQTESARPEARSPEPPRRTPVETPMQPPGARAVQPAPSGQVAVPPGSPGMARPVETPSRSSDTVQLVWPSALNLVPGREAEAAGQILAINGIPPQHPNYQAALMGIQNVLMNFARTNPGGGKLPTAELARILMQFK
jgi:hypothetical protein